MSITIYPTDEELFQRFRNDKDHAAFEMLFRRYWPLDDVGLDWDGENFVDWVRFKKSINAFDAEDIVADCWAYFVINQPDISENFGACAYQKLEWLVRDYRNQRRKRRIERSNYFRRLAAKQKPIIQRAEVTETLEEIYEKTSQLNHFLDLAILQEAINRLPLQEQQTIRLYRIEKRTLEQAAEAASTTFAMFRTRLDQALKLLRDEFFSIRETIETLEDRTTLLSQWGDVRLNRHWKPKNGDCVCPICAKARRENDLYRPSDVSISVAITGVTIHATDRDGYKLPGQKTRVFACDIGNGTYRDGIYSEFEVVA